MSGLNEEVKSNQGKVKGAFADILEYRIKNDIEFKDSWLQNKRITKSDKLNDIVLNIQDESLDFYQAWENEFSDKIDDYLNEMDGERHKATYTTWIEFPPEVLTFQMVRTNQEDGKMVKKQHVHNILPTIHPDRFLF